jgi:UTP--glucose-1-phosphate uridylyltransferase
MNRISTLIIPTAGLGTRLRPVTYVTPKEMLRIVDKPAFYYLLKEAHEASIKNVVFILHKEKPQLAHFFQSEDVKEIMREFVGMKVHFVFTTERLGDGQAILEAKDFIKSGEYFAVSMGDFLSLPGASVIQELYEQHEKHGASIISVAKIPRKYTSLYGVIKAQKGEGRSYRVQGIIEKPKPEEAPSTLAMSAKYILNYEIFPILQEMLKTKSKDEVKLANALNVFTQKNKLIACETKYKSYDMGTKQVLAQTEFAFLMNDKETRKALTAAIKNYVR